MNQPNIVCEHWRGLSFGEKKKQQTSMNNKMGKQNKHVRRANKTEMCLRLMKAVTDTHSTCALIHSDKTLQNSAFISIILFLCSILSFRPAPNAMSVVTLHCVFNQYAVTETLWLWWRGGREPVVIQPELAFWSFNLKLSLWWIG